MMKSAVSLRSKISLMLGILILVPLGGLGALMYFRANRIIIEDITKHTQDVLSLVSKEIQIVLGGGSQALDQLAYDERFIAILQAADERLPEGMPLSLSYETAGILDSVLAAQLYIRTAGVYTRKQMMFRSVPDEVESMLAIQKPYIMSIAVRAKGKAVYTVVPGLEDHLAVCRAIYGSDPSVPFATVAALIPLRTITTRLTEQLSEFSDYFQLVERSSFSKIIQTVEGGVYLGPVVMRKPGVEMQAPTVYYDRPGGRLISYRDLTVPDWRAVLVIPDSVVFKRAYDMRRWILLITMAAMAVSSVAGLFIARSIVSPLMLLIRGMKRMEENPGSYRIPEKRRDEIGYLIDAFNRMSERLDHLFNMVYREQLVRKDTELRALQSQINPHFLFNTLDTISWKARLEGAPTAGDMIATLSRMLSLNIGREGRDLIPLRDELEYLDDYLYLQRIRYEDMISFESALDPELLSCPVPCLILQPLAENAVFHNAPFTKPLRLRLSSRVEDGHVLLTLSDDGKGIPPERLDGIRSFLECEEPRKTSPVSIRGVGLFNVHRRLRLVYGAPCGLRIESEPGGTAVTLRFPGAPGEGADGV